MACWRRAFDAFNAVSPQFVFVWNPNKSSNFGCDVRRVWPGDAYVDAAGVDFYDSYPPTRTQADWDGHYNVTQNGAPFGIGTWLALARAHGKPISFPEWGVNTDPAHPAETGGDNPIFIENMHRVFTEPANNVTYESHFNLNGCVFQVLPESCHPLAAATYRALF